MRIAEINIGLLVMIVWVVLSWLGSSKKRKGILKGGGAAPPRKPSGISQLLRDLGKQFEESAKGEKSASQEMPFLSTEDIDDTPPVKQSPGRPVKVRVQPTHSTQEHTGGDSTNHANIDFTMDTNFARKPTKTIASELYKNLRGARHLQRVVLFKEILGSPRALRPYHPLVTRD